ncbi:MAG: hypothetical protein HFJ58_02765 [Clostridia bacterium]|nr:hypothetical protein [Clostridia bacterium]
MKLLDWIKRLIGKNNDTHLLNASEQEKILSPEEEFRMQCAESAQLSEEEKQQMLMQRERQRQIRVAGYNVINTMINLSNEDIIRNLENTLWNLKTEQLSRTGRSDLSTDVILSELDVETLKHIHFVIQRNPQLSDYINSVSPLTGDNNIVEIVNRMEQVATDEARNWGQTESKAVNYMPNASNIINQLQKEQKEQQMEQE